jgi:hypothetical protein
MTALRQLIRTAMHGKGYATAGAIHDAAVGIALANHWPAAAFPKSVHVTSAELRAMAKAGEVRAGDMVREDGKDRPTYRLTETLPTDGFAPPPPIDPDDDIHQVVEKLSTNQTVTLFDVLTSMSEEYARQDRERQELSMRHHRELQTLIEKARNRLVACGLDDIPAIRA